MSAMPRVIPCLLLSQGGLVKTIRFKHPTYVGDPINVVRILNEKEVDELIFLDIDASTEGRGPRFDYIEQVTSECFMPVAYGGGVGSVEDARRLLSLGVEKVCLNTAAIERPGLVGELADVLGSQSVIVSIDVRRDLWGRYRVASHGGRRKTGLKPTDHARRMEELGAGEILINSIDRDGTMSAYDYALVKSVTAVVNVPVIACGGAGRLDDFRKAVTEAGASAVAAGSLFVFQGPHRAVLVTYPERRELLELFGVCA
jgi:cyclase